MLIRGVPFNVLFAAQHGGKPVLYVPTSSGWYTVFRATGYYFVHVHQDSTQALGLANTRECGRCQRCSCSQKQEKGIYKSD